MSILSKFQVVPYTCYEMGHTWHHSCTKCAFDMFISSFTASLKIYGVVYLLTALVSRKKLSKTYAIQLFKNYLQSVVFLSYNGSFYVASFCILRRLFGHINFLSASWLPGFIASYLAIYFERPSRHPLLALYVTNVASESFWRMLNARGYVRSLPKGEVLLFAASMTLFGYYFKSASHLNSFIYSAFKFILGTDEAGKKDSITPPPRQVRRETKWRHRDCHHDGSCIANGIKMALVGGLKGYLIHVGFKGVTSLPRLAKNPRLMINILLGRSSFRTAAFLGWFASVFKVTCCTARWVSGKDKPVHGAYAGGLAALGMAFNSNPSVATYAFWKALETVYSKGIEANYLPSIPYSIQLLYAFSTAYLFHAAVLENFNMKQSYWQFLNNLTSGKVDEMNKALLDCYGLDSGRNQVWPSYDKTRLTEDFIREFYN